MIKLDISYLEHLMEVYLAEHDAFSKMCDNHNAEQLLHQLKKIDDVKMDIGYEFCRLTADRNSMNVAHLITPTIAQSLIDSVKSGRYK